MIPHLLYSYRRCPYAMRARIALVLAKIQCSVYEVDFKDKPAHMLEISPKGTVPILQISKNEILEESLDIVFWSLKNNDPLGLLIIDLDKAKALISENDGAFKRALDRYKYPNRFPDEGCSHARERGLQFLNELEDILSSQTQLAGETISVADICIFPFIRQFSNVDRTWFEEQDLPNIKTWLNNHLESDLFKKVIQKPSASPYLLI